MKNMKNIKRIICALILGVLFFQVPLTANAAIYGGKWKTDIYFYVDTSDDSIGGSFSVARDSWNDVLKDLDANIKIHQVWNKSSANVVVSTQSYIGAVALTTLSPGKNSSSYKGGTIKVNPNQYNHLSSTEKLYVATHELGHILGLDDNDLGKKSVMNRSVGTTAIPTSYDKKELGRIY